jgi:polyvinyl alcohol dehydrogenase (cytochrome)
VLLALIALVPTMACSSDDDEPAGGTGRTTTAASDATRSTADAGDAPWVQFGHDLANTRTNPFETAVTAETVGDLVEQWSIDGLVGVTASPTIVEGTAYFGDWSGGVHAVEVETGEEVWSATLGGTVIGSLPVDGDALYASSGRTLFRLDRATGEVEWEATVDEHPFAMISASPVVADGLVFQGVASGEVTVPQDDYTFIGSIAAYDTESGEQVWRLETTPGDERGGAGVGVWSTPSVDQERGLLFVGSGNSYEEPTAPLADSILAIDVETGEVVWSTQFTDPDVFSAGNPTGKDADVGASPNLWTSDGRDLVGAGDKAGVFHALDRETGEVVWETTLTPGSVFGGDIGSSAFVDGTLIVTSNVGNPENNAPTNASKVFALDPADGTIRWEVELDEPIFAPVSAVPGVAFVGTTMGTLLAFDVATGDELFRAAAPNQVGAGPTIIDGHVLWGYGYALFDGPGAGGIIAFGLDDAAGGGGPDEDPTTTGRGAAGDAAPAPSAGCDAPTTAEAGVSDRTMTSGGQERRFQLVVPDGYDGSTALPLVFGLHGLTVSYTVVPGMSGFGDMAEQYDFIGVSPSGLLDATVPYWIAAPVEGNRDVAFIADLLDLLGDELCIDTARVFSTGMSNGGQMSSLLACELPDRFTAVAPLAGVEFSTECADGAVPVMAFHGDADPVVTYEGGGLHATAIADLHAWKGEVPEGLPVHGGVEEAMANWATHNGCDAAPHDEILSPDVRRLTWDGCDAPTVLYVTIGGGHTWPGKPMPGFEETFGYTTTDIDATALMFEFFLGAPEP